MANQKKSKRSSERLPVTPQEFKGRLVDRTGGTDEIALVWNVSAEGLCLWATKKYQQGEQLKLVASFPWTVEINCQVRWSRAVPESSGFLLGLEALDHHDKLAELHTRLNPLGKKAG